MKNNLSLTSSKGNVIPSNVNLINDLKTLSDNIVRSQDELQETLEELESSSIDIDIKSNWIGIVKKSSLEQYFEDIYSNLSYYIGKCGEALKNTNENLGRTLDLIKLLTLVEKDLYEHIEYQTVSNNELKAILLDWFKKQGIKDEDIQELIETSFQRAYTLRDRLNTLRKECHENIAQCINRIKVFENKYSLLDNEIAQHINYTKSELQNSLEENKCTFEALYNERYSILDDLGKNLYNRLETANNKISENLILIEKTFSKINDKENEFNSLSETKFNELSQVKNDAEEEIKKIASEKENEIVERFTSSYHDFFDNLTRTSIEAQNKIEEKKQSIENSINETKSSFENNIQEYNNTLETIRISLKDEFQNQIKVQNEKFEKEKLALMSSFKNKIIWTIISSTAISSVVAYLVATLIM